MRFNFLIMTKFFLALSIFFFSFTQHYNYFILVYSYVLSCAFVRIHFSFLPSLKLNDPVGSSLRNDRAHSGRAIKSALNKMKPEYLERVHLTLGETGGVPDVRSYETSPVALPPVVDCLIPSCLYRSKNDSTVQQGRKIPPLFFITLATNALMKEPGLFIINDTVIICVQTQLLLKNSFKKNVRNYRRHKGAQSFFKIWAS